MSANLVSPVFVGRRAERPELIDLLHRAIEGTTEFALVGGEAGVGKSRLVAELIAEARAHDVLVLSGHCVQLGTEGLPFAPLVDALRDLARSMPLADFDRAMGPARSALLRLLPNIDLPADSEVGGPITQGSQLLELVLGMFERLSGSRPVLLVIEDLHWADQSTLDLVAYLVRALRDVPVALVGTYRSDELNRRHPLRSLLLAWERSRAVRLVGLARFDRDEVADQLAAILGRPAEPALVDVVFERSEGNAFLVEEILGVVLAGGDANALPPSLRDLLLARVDGLGSDAQRMLSTAAVGGRWVSEQLVLTVSGLDEPAAFAGLREAVEQHLLVVDEAGRGYSFRHALARDAVYDDLLPGERVRLHAAYGEALEAHPELAGDDAGAVAADLAHHWYVALDLPRALGASVRASERALDRFAPNEALRHLERALQIWPRVPDAEQITGIDHVEALRRAAQVASDVGEVHRSLSLIGEALDDLGEAGDPDRRASLLERRGRALYQAGEGARSLEAFEQARALLPDVGNTVAYVAVNTELANAMIRAGRWADASELSERAASVAAAVGAERELAEALLTSAIVRVMLGDEDGGVAAGREAIDRALRLGQSRVPMRGYINLSDTLELLGRSAEAASLAAEGRQLAERAGYGRSAGAFLAGNEAESLTRLGRWDEAERLVTGVLSVDPEGVYAATLLDARTQIAVRRGRYDQARGDLARARSLVGDQGELQYTRSFAISEAFLRLAEGDLSGTLAAIVAELDNTDIELRYDWTLLWLALRTEADLARRARDLGEPVAPANPAITVAYRRLQPDTAPSRAFRAMCEAELARAAGTDDAAAWEEVAALWRELGRPYELAECLWRAGEQHAVSGERAAAERALTEAHRLAAAMGAAPLLERIDQLARQARVTVTGTDAPPAAAAAGPADALERFGLTQREREVLGMVAAGRTNPEIAKSLYISPKTASVHVSNILAKLGVASRVEAATMAHRLGVPAPGSEA